jgi:WD40 repeat protein
MIPQSERPRVFISYARKDGDDFAHRLRERIELEQPEITIWQDRVRLEGGVGWWTQITEALDQVEFMVLVMSSAAIESAVIRKEWRYARQQGVCVYPVVADTLIDFSRLPRWMSKTHFFHLEHEWDTFINYLKSPCRVTRVPFMAPDLPEGFVKRRTLFESLIKSLTETDRQNLALTTALYGAGGLGKTTLAAALCHHDETMTTFDDGILWITLGNQPNVLEGLTKLYAALTGERPGFIDEEDAAVHLAEKLEQKNCLIVIDDAWDTTHLRPFLRGGSGCVRLITTRIFEVASEAVRFNVDVMTATEAVQMLTTNLGRPIAETALFSDVAERLDKWPLLLEMANATLRYRLSRGDTLEGALAYLNRKLDKQGVVAFDKRNAIERHQAIASTIDISLELLDANERQRCTELAIFPEDAEVPLAVVTELWGVDDFEAEELVQKLDNFSLLKFNLQAATVRLHDVVRSYLSTQLVQRAELQLKLTKTWGDAHSLPHAYAWRWLSYHLMEAGQSEKLRQLLLDFKWLQKKLEATNTISLMADYERVVGNDRDLNFVLGAIRLSAYVIARDKTQFAGQLLARLPNNKSANIDNLRNQAVGWRDGPWLRPLMPLLTQPGGPLLFTLAGHTARVRDVAITTDGKQAVSASDDHTLKVWDLERGTEVYTLNGHSDWVRAVAIFPNATRAVSASDDHTLRVWNIESGTLDMTMDNYGDWIRKLTVTPNGRYAISASDDRTLKIWDLERGTIKRSLKGHSGELNALAITADGRFLLSGSDDRTIRLWDVEHGTQVRTLKGHRAKVNALAVSPNGRQVVSASADDTLRLWDTEQAESVSPETITEQAHWVKDLAFTPDGRRVIAASEDNTLRIWNLEHGTEEPALEGHTDWVNAVVVSNDGQYAVSASDDRTVKIWDFNHQTTQRNIRAHNDRVRAVTVTPDGKRALSVSDDGRLVVWDAQRGALEHTFTGFDYWVMAVTHDNQRVISAHSSATLKVWDLESGKEQSAFTAHADRVRALAVTPDGEHAVSAGDDRTIRLWDIRTGEEKLRIHVKAHWVRGLAVTPDGHYVLSASDRRSLKLWSLNDGSEIRTFMGHTARVNAVAIDPSGRLAISASDDHTLRAWNVETGTALHQFTGHTASVNAVTIGKLGRHAISVSSDNTLKVWDLDHGTLITTFTAESPLLTCAFSPLESTIVAGDQSGNVHFLCIKEPLKDDFQ